MSSYIVLLFPFIYYSVDSAACVPANTCFQINAGNSNTLLDNSFKLTCSNGQAFKQVYAGVGDCSGFPETDEASTLITRGDSVSGSDSGTIETDYLQGVGCPQLTDPSEDCQDFIVLKHKGTRAQIYLDIGVNCTNYLTDPPDYGQSPPTGFAKYSMVIVPFGCVDLFSAGSQKYWCDANGWYYHHYEFAGCTGDILSAQSEDFAVDRCAYFSEWTHCNDPQISEGCVNDGVHDFWHYWYDLECCPVAGKTCCGAPSLGPTAYTNCPTTDRPSVSPTLPTTPVPSKAPQQSGNQPQTSDPTTSAPTNAAGTAKPTTTTTSSPSKQPTIPGTARPTMPTTNAPTNVNGTARPTQPTTGSPTSPGNTPARPITTKDENGQGGGKTGGGECMIAGLQCVVFWIIIIVVIVILCCCIIVCCFVVVKKKKDHTQYFGNQDDRL